MTINAEYQAEKLIADLGLSIPINPREVCNAISTNSFEVQYEEHELNTENICGLSIANPDGVIVVVNTSINNSARRLFTAAHEIGHVLLHIQTGKRQDTQCSNLDISINEGKDLEAEANSFASALLMPSWFIREKISREDITWDLIGNIATQHRTSLEATARRVVSLARDPYALLIHDKGKMWSPIKSNSFCFSIQNSCFPKYLDKEIYTDSDNLPDELKQCDLSDWGLNLQKRRYNCRYSSLSFDRYNKAMTLLHIEEIEEEEEDVCWEGPHY